MKTDLTERVLRIGEELDGVFTIKDLEIALNEKSGASFYRAIERLIARKKLIKVKKRALCNRISDACCNFKQALPTLIYLNWHSPRKKQHYRVNSSEKNSSGKNWRSKKISMFPRHH